MKELGRCMRAELVKMRHTFLYPLHIAAPVIVSVVFLLYYGVSGRGGTAQITVYAEVIGVALPILVSIVCAGNVGLEEQNHFQNFPGGTVHRWMSFLAKYLALAGLGILAVLAAVFLFAAGNGGASHMDGVSLGMYGLLAAMLCLGSLPLYLEHLFFCLAFPGAVSLCIGVIEFLLSALFLTGLGEGRWMFFFCTWSARGASLVFTDFFKEEMQRASAVCLLIGIVVCVIIGIWFHFYEGRQCND